MTARSRSLRGALVVALVVATAASTAPARAGTDDPWLAMLSRVPDEPAYRGYVVLDDYEAARQAFDVEATGTRAFARLTLDAGLGPTELVATLGRDGDALEDELGIPVLKVDRDLVTGLGPDTITVLDGGISREKVQRAVEADDEWADLLARERHAGQTYFAWDGEDLHVDRITPVRRLGRGGRLAVDPPLAVWTNTDRAMEASLEASAHDLESLADDPDIEKIVGQLRDADAYSMVLTDDPPTGVATGGPEPLVTPKLVALGGGFADGKPQVIVVLAQANAADARTNADRFRAIVEQGTSEVTGEPWSEVLEIDDISTDGNLVVARLASESTREWLQVVLTRDSLLASGG